ncbi:MAG: hypothetical protein LBD97_03780 [Bifidobacteriaceae bacterium]|nr:hypothetical protein [Bifidobacteriaceae bacterium]
MAIALVASVAFGVGPLAPKRADAADSVTFVVNSTELIVAGSSCEADGVCTLRQAIEDANEVAPEKEVRIEVADGVFGDIPFPTALNQLMTTDDASPGDTSGAVFWVKRSMTIDLDGRLHLRTPNGTLTAALAAGLWVDAPNVSLLDFDDWTASYSAIVFSAASDGSSLRGGHNIQSRNYHTNRFVAVLGGADNITIEDLVLGHQYSGQLDGGSIALTPSTTALGSSAEPITNLTIKGVTFDNTTVAGSHCSTTDGMGCLPTGVNVTNNVKVDGLIIEDCVFVNFGADALATGQPIDAYYAGDGSNWDIRNNVFTDIQVDGSELAATILLPFDNRLSGVNYIRNNIFDNAATASTGSQSTAISWNSASYTENGTATKPSNLFIQDNYFNGYGKSLPTIRLTETGTTTVRRNVFGTATTAAAETEKEETASDKVMFDNYNATSNRDIRTWRPVAYKLDQCVPTVQVAANTAGTSPNTPVTLDFYWTKATTAEVYLGSVEGVTGGGWVTLDQIPAEGYIRVQTHGAGTSPDQPESSQYSKTLAVPAPPDCSPKLEIDLQVWTDVPSDATSYEAIMDSGATELPEAARIPPGAAVWLTYTVRNTGNVNLERVAVKDRGHATVCVIALIEAGDQAGCARATVIPETAGE